MTEEVRQSDMIDGEEKVKAQIIRYDADTFNAAAMMQMAQHALSGEPTVAAFVVGGLSKRDGLAMNFFSAYLKENEGDMEEALEDSFDAADLFMEMSRKRNAMRAGPTGLGNAS